MAEFSRFNGYDVKDAYARHKLEGVPESIQILNERMDNMVSGSTPDGSELIDARVSIDGVTHESTGTAIRSVTRSIANQFINFNTIALKGIEIEESQNVNLTLDRGWFLNQTTASPEALNNLDPLWHISHPIEVSPGEVYIISGYGNWGTFAYAFYNENNYVISGLKRDENNTNVVNEVVIAPVGATTLRVCGNEGEGGQIAVVRRATKLSFADTTSRYSVDFLNNLLNNSSLKAIAGENVVTGWLSNYVLEEGNLLLTNDTTNNYQVSEPIPVKPGEWYKVVGCMSFQKEVYAIYDKNDKVIAELDTDYNTMKHFDGVVIIPQGASYMRVSYMKSENIEGGVFPITKLIAGDNTWDGLKWVCVGDSLTESNQRTSINYHDYIKNRMGIEVVNMGASGTGYARGQDEGKAFYQRIASVPTDADVITIFGSFNDISSGLSIGSATDSGTNTIAGCINKTLDNLFETYPLAKVGVITPTPWNTVYPEHNEQGDQYVEMIMAICNRRGVPCLDLYHSSGLRPWESSYRELCYSNDEGNGVHPDETGHEIISRPIELFLRNFV